MTSHSPPLALTALTTSILAALTACPDDEQASAGDPDTVRVEELTGSIVIERTYPDEEAFAYLDVYVGLSPARQKSDDFGRQTAAELVSLVMRHPASGLEAPMAMELVGSDLETALVPADGRITKLLLNPDGVTNGDLAAFCDLTGVELTLTVRVPECDCTGTVTAPIVPSCRADRRARALLDVADAGTPAGLPCRTVGVAPSSTVTEYGYDEAGNHRFTDTFYRDSPLERIVYEYDGGGRLVASVVVDPASGEKVRERRWTRDDGQGGLITTGRVDTYLPEEQSAAITYDYPNADDWVVTDTAGDVREQGTWRGDRLEITDAEGTLTAILGQPYARASWLGTTDVARFHALEPATLSNGPVTRTLTWQGGRITGDTTTTTAGVSVAVTWEYDDCD